MKQMWNPPPPRPGGKMSVKECHEFLKYVSIFLKYICIECLNFKIFDCSWSLEEKGNEEEGKEDHPGPNQPHVQVQLYNNQTHQHGFFVDFCVEMLRILGN